MDQKVTIGNPLELFRELETIFETQGLELVGDVEPDLVTTPLSGIAKFKGELRSRSIPYSISKRRSEGSGVGLLGFAAILALLEILYFGITLNFYTMILYGGIISLVLFAMYCFGFETITYNGYVQLDIKGEAYEARAQGSQGQRASVLSRGRLQTHSFNDTNSPNEFQSQMSERWQKLDVAIREILPKFELEKTELPDTKS